MSYNANGLTKEQETRINKQLIRMKTYTASSLMIAPEAQYQFLKYLESMDLTEKQIRNIFVNSTI